MKIDVSKEVESLIKKAEATTEASEAMRFSQAACNAANAMVCINTNTDREE